MLQAKAAHAGIACGAGSVVERRVALKQRYDGRGILKWEEFAVSPDAAAIARLCRSGSGAPVVAKHFRIAHLVKAALNLERAAAAGADVNSFAKSKRGATCRQDAPLNSLLRSFLGSFLRSSGDLFNHSSRSTPGFLPALARRGQIHGAWPSTPPSHLSRRPQTKCCTPRN